MRLVVPDEREAAIALQRAADRFLSVGEDGSIIEPWDRTELYTPTGIRT